MAFTLNTVKGALNSDIAIDQLAGAKACKQLSEDLGIYKLWERSSSWSKVAAALYGEKSKASDRFLLHSLTNSNLEVRRAANWNASDRVFSDDDVVRIFEKFPDDIPEMGGYVEHIHLDKSTLASLVYSASWQERCFAQRALSRAECPSDWVLYGLRDKDFAVRNFAVNAAKYKGISINTLYEWANSVAEPLLWRSVLVLCKENNEAIKVVEDAISAGVDIDLVGKTVVTLDIPMETLERWYETDLRFRIAAIYGASRHKDVPREWLESDTNPVYKKPIALLRKSLGLPPTRSFSPPDLVYKSCLGGVIVTGVIPDDAEIRGDGVSGRTDKFIVKDVMGEFYGEKVGISTFDLETSYRAGDEVEDPNYDMGQEIYAPGIHFYCSKSAI